MKKNRADINTYVVDPDARRFVDQVNRSANVLKKLPVKAQLPENAAKTFDTLAKGDMFTLLHGRATGAIAGGAAGYGAGAVLGMTLPMQIAAEALGAVAGGYGSNVVGSTIRGGASRLVYGTTQQVLTLGGPPDRRIDGWWPIPGVNSKRAIDAIAHGL
jgi:hypothetical protein